MEPRGYSTVAAISANGDLTVFSKVTWPNKGDPLYFSMRAAIPPNGEM
jgi:hypothetical protein